MTVETVPGAIPPAAFSQTFPRATGRYRSPRRFGGYATFPRKRSQFEAGSPGNPLYLPPKAIPPRFIRRKIENRALEFLRVGRFQSPTPAESRLTTALNGRQI